MANTATRKPKLLNPTVVAKDRVAPADIERAFADVKDTMVTHAQDPWATSPYAWIRTLKSRRMGKAGEQIIEQWLNSDEFTVGKADSSDADRSINLHQVEIKLSTLWESGCYKFQQIRDQRYSHAVLLGVSPHRLHVWCVPKQVLRRHSASQHGGKKGADTAWLTVDPSKTPDWLDAYGGTVEAGLAIIRSSLTKPNAA